MSHTKSRCEQGVGVIGEQVGVIREQVGVIGEQVGVIGEQVASEQSKLATCSFEANCATSNGLYVFTSGL